MKIQSIVVGIFDNAQDLDRAAKRLVAAGSKDIICDEAIAEESCHVDPIPVGSMLAAGAVLAKDWSSVEPVRAFKSHLADYDLPEQTIEAYATTFSHGGRFALVRIAPERAEKAKEILRECGVSRVDRHD